MTTEEKKDTFGKFIKEYEFVIPDYQRAYSWTAKQLIQFINDIAEHQKSKSTYYLGHYILEIPKKNSLYREIVDGQQRINTVYLFLMVCGYLNGIDYIKEINFSPVSYDLDGLKAIKAILAKRGDIDTELEAINKTSSLKKMAEVVRVSIKAFSDPENDSKLLNVENIDDYVNIIFNAHYSKAVFKDKSVASQIFELHNTRGVKLTETEKVKALLMKSVYLHSKDSEKHQNVSEIQAKFAQIFEMEEKASDHWLRGALTLDTILMYHLKAVDDGNKTEGFGLPVSVEGEKGSFQYIKGIISKKSKEAVLTYAKKLAEEFLESMKIITIRIPNADINNRLIGDILLLDKAKSLIFLLRAFRCSEEDPDYKMIQRWENFVLCYDMIYWLGFFHRIPYENRSRFEHIYKSLKPDLGFESCNTILYEFYTGKWFASGWGHLRENTNKWFEDKNRWIYGAYGWSRTGYFLYKYELYNGSEVEKIRKGIFKEDKVSIDHIVAREISWKNLGFENYDKLPQDDELRKTADILWKEIQPVLNGIGNLALSTRSGNSSASNHSPKKHMHIYERMGLEKTVSEVKHWQKPEDFHNQIRERTKLILDFIEESIINKKDIWE